MACQDCQETPKSFKVTYSYDPNCGPQSPCSGDQTDSSCVIYTGANLGCTGVAAGDSLELAIQKLNNIICNTTEAGFPSYNYHCLVDDGPISSQGEFVSRITQKVCDVNTSLTTFVNTTFPAYQTSINSSIAALNTPGVTCTSASVVATDTLKEILNKYCNKFSSIDNNLDLTGVNWSQCFTVSTPPTTIKEGFGVLLQQICSVKNSGSTGALPTFNNVGTCLPTPVTSSDSLVDTVTKIRTRLCQTPTFSTSGINFGCVPTPATISLDTVIANILSKVTTNTQNQILQVEGGTIEPIDGANPCLGNKIVISGTGTDRLVAASDDDNVPGTLADKLNAGDGVSIDTATDPTKASISTDGKVLASDTDTTRGTLADKLVQDINAAILIDITSTGTTDQNITLGGRINNNAFLDAFFTALEGSPVFRQRFCNIVSSCGTVTTVSLGSLDAGPTGGNAGGGYGEVFSTVPFTTDTQEFTLGAVLYQEEQGINKVPDGRYFHLWGVYHYADVADGVVTAIGDIDPVNFVTITPTSVGYSAGTIACDAPRGLIIYTDGSLDNGKTAYKDIFHASVADDGNYVYRYYSSGGASFAYKFSVASGVISGNSPC